MRSSKDIIKDIRKSNNQNDIDRLINELTSNRIALNKCSIDELDEKLKESLKDGDKVRYIKLSELKKLKLDYDKNIDLIEDIEENGVAIVKKSESRKIVKRCFKTALIVSLSLGGILCCIKIGSKISEGYGKVEHGIEKVNEFFDYFKHEEKEEINYDIQKYDLSSYGFLYKYKDEIVGVKINDDMKYITLEKAIKKLDKKMTYLSSLNQNEQQNNKKIEYLIQNGSALNKSITNRLFKDVLKPKNNQVLNYISPKNSDKKVEFSSVKVYKNGKEIKELTSIIPDSPITNIIDNYDETNGIRTLKKLYYDLDNLSKSENIMYVLDDGDILVSDHVDENLNVKKTLTLDLK